MRETLTGPSLTVTIWTALPFIVLVTKRASIAMGKSGKRLRACGEPFVSSVR